MKNIYRSLGYPNGIEVSSVGRSGGLALGWKNTCTSSLRSFSLRHIYFFLNDDSDGLSWHYMGFYGAVKESNRMDSWNLIRHLNDCPDIPWLVIGDFNEILYAYEKQEESCENEIQQLWENSLVHILSRLECMKKGLDSWFKWIKRDRKLTESDLKKCLTDLSDLYPTDDVLNETLEVQLASNLEMDKEELYWDQRARENWLKNGDRNTSFSHKFASQRRRHNKVSKSPRKISSRPLRSSPDQTREQNH
ncbi:hypothetical protein GQ457_03G024890 [Hibiscus cannabinus]